MLMETCALAVGADVATKAAKVKNAATQRSAFHPRGRSLILDLPRVGILLGCRVMLDGGAILI
jgi:hypothetical protein